MGANSGRKVEKQILKKIKARPQPNSGAFPGMPNDGIKGRYLIEIKSSEHESIGVKKKWLYDLERDAIMRGKIGALILAFSSKDFTGTIEINPWVAIPLFDFERLTAGWSKF